MRRAGLAAGGKPDRLGDLLLQPAHQGLCRRRTAVAEPVGQHAVAALGQDRLRVELNTVDRKIDVPHGHDDAATRFRGDVQLGWHAAGHDGQRVVPGCGEGVGQTLQHTVVGVHDGARLAVQELRRTIHGRPEGDTDRLVSEADTQ